MGVVGFSYLSFYGSDLSLTDNQIIHDQFNINKVLLPFSQLNTHCFILSAIHRLNEQTEYKDEQQNFTLL